MYNFLHYKILLKSYRGLIQYNFHVTLWTLWKLYKTSPFSLVPTTTKPALHDCGMDCILYVFIKICVTVQNVFVSVCFIYACILSCFLVCWSAWLSWRSVWPWTMRTRSYWLSLQSQYLYRSDRPPASGERRCVQKRTHGTLQPERHQALVRSNKAAGEQMKNTMT